MTTDYLGTYHKKFTKLNYNDDVKGIRHPILTPLLIRYHGMGHYQVLCVNSKLRFRRQYVLVPLGGSDGHACKANDLKFQKLNHETRYFTLEQAYQYAKTTAHGSLY